MDPILFDLPDELETPRLCMRVPRTGDGPAVVTALLSSRAEVAAWMSWLTPEYGEADAELWARRAHARFLLREEMTFILFDRASGEVVGGMGPHRFDWKVGLTEVGYWLRTDRTGQGLMSEALKALCAMLFARTGLNRIEIRCDDLNLRSARVAESCGFTLEGTLRGDALDPAGKPRSTRIYALLRG